MTIVPTKRRSFAVLLFIVSGCHDASQNDDASVDDASAIVHDLAQPSDTAVSRDASSSPDVGTSVTIVAEDGGAKGFAQGAVPFVPIGVNYFIEGSGENDGTAYKTFDTFDTQTFDLTVIDQALAGMSQNGFNYVRLWLKGVDTDRGFAKAGMDGGFDPGTFDAYVTNIVTTIHAARAHGLQVVLTGSFPGPDGTDYMPANYIPAASSLPPTTAIDGSNRLLLIPAMSAALGQFYADLLAALLAKDPGIAASIFYFDVYNETHFDLTSVPLSQMSGTFLYDGAMYDLSNFTADTTNAMYAHGRQALMDTAARNFLQTLSGGVHAKVPAMHVTASSYYNYAFKHLAFDGGALNALKANNYPLRPFFELEGGADIIDIHNYPSPAGGGNVAFDQRAATVLLSNEILPVGASSAITTSISAATAPLISGEFGAELASYGVVDTTTPTQYITDLQAAIVELQAAEQAAFCDFYFAGYGVWDWDVPSSTFALVATSDPNSLFMQALAPKYVPKYCGRDVTP